MWILSALIGIAGGLLAMSSLIAKKSANAQEQLAKLAVYQGWIGLVMFGWGVWELIGAVLSLGSLSAAPLLWTFGLLSGVADFTVGLILGFGLISTYAFRGNETAIAKGNALREKLVAFQVPLGGLAIVMSVLFAVFNIL